MRPKYYIPLLTILLIAVIFMSGCVQQREGLYLDLEDCQKPELKQKCDEYCSKNPGSCPGWRSTEPLPSEEEKTSLTRNYPDVIKAINEGPAMYGQGPGTQGSITDESLKEMKETGFNTVQLFISPEHYFVIHRQK